MTCPCCGNDAHEPFYRARNSPVHNVLLMPTREAALGYPRRDLVLHYCRSCGFIFNAVFDPSLHDYSRQYEETQGFSPTFAAFHRRLAERLVERHGLRNKRVIEIGCGKGEFLGLLCEAGGNRGIGFDPAFVPERRPAMAHGRVEFISDFYGDQHSSLEADFICCKMTLEHIAQPVPLLNAVRGSAGRVPGAIVFFMVPDAVRILEELAFWDVYYEHCCYFSPGSLARLFERCRFQVLAVDREYAGQYITIEARADDGVGTRLSEADDLAPLQAAVECFARETPALIQAWRERLHQYASRGATVAVWGGGSKAVAFLTVMGTAEEVACVVDVNPYRQETWMPGSGHPIVSPARLAHYRPDVVIIMNPVYRTEIGEQLRELSLAPELVTLSDSH